MDTCHSRLLVHAATACQTSRLVRALRQLRISVTDPAVYRVRREQMVYKVSAIAASLGVISLAVAAVYLRFHWHMEAGGEFPWAEAAATLLLTIGGAVRLSACLQFQDCYMI